jgi:hypothetical protein
MVINNWRVDSGDTIPIATGFAHFDGLAGPLHKVARQPRYVSITKRWGRACTFWFGAATGKPYTARSVRLSQASKPKKEEPPLRGKYLATAAGFNRLQNVGIS